MADTDPTDVPDPLAEQRAIMETLGQETRHKILQMLLGHPDHLASTAELNHMVASATEKAVTDQLEVLIDDGILAAYTHPPNKNDRGLPWQFYGFTEYGIDILGDYGYLNSVPMLRAIYEKTRTTEQVERHEAAPRPTLPDAVRTALTAGGEDMTDRSREQSTGQPSEASADGVEHFER